MRMFRKIGLLLPLGLLAFAGGTVRSIAQQQDSVSVIPEPAHVSRGTERSIFIMDSASIHRLPMPMPWAWRGISRGCWRPPVMVA